MATRIKRYEDKLNPQNQHVREWFEQFELDLEVQSLVLPEAPADNAEPGIITAYENAVSVMNRKRSAHLLTSCSSDMFVLVKSLVSPEPIGAMTYEQLRDVVIDHLAPKPTTISTIYQFQNTKQKPNESAADYIARLRQVAMDCEFENFNQSLLRQFVCGLEDKQVQTKMLEEDISTLTLTTAYQKVVNMVRSQREAELMQSGPSQNSSVHKLQFKNNNNSSYKRNQSVYQKPSGVNRAGNKNSAPLV